jgi:small GTP-binding protein
MSNPQAKVILVGSMAVGKTCISNRCISGNFDTGYQATIGVGYGIVHATVNGKDVELQLWDTAGMEQYTPLGPIYYQSADAAIFVYDLTAPETAADLDGWYDNFSKVVHDDWYGIVVGNKLDLCQNVDTRLTEEWAKIHRLSFLTVSAKT